MQSRRTLLVATAVALAGVALAQKPLERGPARVSTPTLGRHASPTPTRPIPAASPTVLAAGPTPTPTSTPTPTPTPTPVPGQIRVTVQVVGPDKKVVPGKDAAVWLPGSGRPVGAPPGLRTLTIASKKKRFEPRVSVVAKGTTVDFPNLDKIFHNAFSLSDAATFDLGLYRNGASKPWRFEKTGTVRVYCNIHPEMAAFVHVVDGQILGTTGPDGTVVLTGVPPGRHAVSVWDEKAGEWSGSADVAPGKTTEVPVRLDASAWKAVPHKNKHGKDYPPPDEDENRY